MTRAELVEKLRSMYHGAEKGETAVMVHLFGIKYADELSEHQLEKVAEDAGIPSTYQTEIRKGMNLSRFVDVKPNVKL